MKRIVILVVTIIYGQTHALFDYDRAAVAYARNDLQSASERLSHLLIDAPNNPSLLYDAGVVAYRQNNFNLADSYFKQASLGECADSLREQIYFNQANANVKLNELQEALNLYSKVLRINPDNEKAQHNYKKVKEMLEHEQQSKQEQNDTSKDNQSSDKKNKDDKQHNEKNSDQQSRKDDQSGSGDTASDADKSSSKKDNSSDESPQQDKNQGDSPSDDSSNKRPEKNKQSQGQNSKGAQEEQKNNEQEKKDAERRRQQHQKDDQERFDNQQQKQAGSKDTAESDSSEEDGEQDSQSGIEKLDPGLARLVDEQGKADASLNKQLIKMVVENQAKRNNNGPEW